MSTPKNLTPEQCQAIVQKLAGSARVELKGDDVEHMLTIFSLMEPINASNNQRTITYEYNVGGTRYDVTWFSDEDQPMIERFL